MTKTFYLDSINKHSNICFQWTYGHDLIYDMFAVLSSWYVDAPSVVYTLRLAYYLTIGHWNARKIWSVITQFYSLICSQVVQVFDSKLLKVHIDDTKIFLV